MKAKKSVSTHRGSVFGRRRGMARSLSLASQAESREFRTLLREAEDVDVVATLLGVTRRSVNRWLAGAAAGAAVRKHVRLLLWLEDEGVDLVALARRDPAALEALREDAAAGDEPALGRDGQPVLP